MQLTRYFALEEFLKTNHAELVSAQAEEVKNYIPSLKILCLYILEHIRRFYNKPIIISSGFRGKSLNAKISGASASQHCTGQAADITVKGAATETIINDIKSGKLCIYFGQCIKESVDGKEWIHISLGYPFRIDKPNMQLLKTTDSKNYEEILSV